MSIRSLLLLFLVAGCHNALDIPAGSDLAVPAGSDLAAASDGGHVVCASLDEQGCKQHSECVIDWCPLCGCNIGFGACRAPGDPVIAKCPGLGCDSGECCRKDGDCGSNEACGAGQRSCCGSGAQACVLDACQADADCPANGSHPGICEPAYFVEGTGHRCEVGCNADAECGTGSTCTNNRCQLPPCGTCPPDFTCTAGQCVASSCNSDNDCAVGVCTFGQCSSSLGYCAPTVQACATQP